MAKMFRSLGAVMARLFAARSDNYKALLMADLGLKR
jgi:hypothetical protein